MAKSLAAVFSGVGMPWAFVEQPIPDLQTHEILVKTLGCTVCGSDLHSIDGRRNVPTPSVLGHEIVGEIVAFGQGAPRFDASGESLHLRDRIVWSVVASCGDCFYCRHELPQKCERGFKYGHQSCDANRTLSGGFSEYIVLAPGTAVVRLPPELSLEAACPLSCATSTIAAAIRLLRVRSGDEVLVVGAGLLGLTSCAMASDLGARRIVCVDMDANRAQRSRSFGAHHAYIPQQSDSSFRDQAQPHGFDIAIECTGSNQATSMAFESLRIGGRLGLVGAVFPTPELPLAMERIVRRQLLVQGIHNYAPEDLVAAVAFMARVHQRFPFAQLVGPSFPLTRIDAAIDAARNPSHIRVCIRPDQPG